MQRLNSSNFDFKKSNKHKYGYDLQQSRITIYNQKTSKDVYIPIKPLVFEIFKKYDFKLPKRCHGHIIDHLRYIAKVAGINDSVSKVRYSPIVGQCN